MRRPSGFTLIEIMIVLAVIGVLSSVALPMFRDFQLRSKQSERTIMLESIRASVEDYAMREGRLPADWGGGNSGLSLWGNPDWTVATGHKRPFRHVSWGDHWNQLALLVEGGLYYMYWGTGQQFASTRQYWLIADADLDGDGVNNQVQRMFLYQGTVLQRFAGVAPNAKWTWEWEFPPGGRTF